MNVSAFIPIDRRRALLTGRDLPDRTHGAALFVDISGFTAMTEMLMRQFGRQEGAEAVLHYLNPINDLIIAELYRFGGSVIGFAGDSITCWLDGDDGRRAVQCGLAMQRLVQQTEMPRLPQGDHLSLGIKVAIAVGPARRFVVGTEVHGLIDVLAGRTVLRMAAAEGLAQRGDVVVDVENCAGILPDLAISAWRADGRVAVVTQLRQPLYDLSPYGFNSDEWQLLPEQARPWLHEPVFERLQMGSDFLAELRPATALFLKFEGIDFDRDDDAGLHLNQFIQWVQGWLKQLSGYLIQLTFGDKGSYLYVAFGAPRSFQNEESRAVALGLALRSACSRFPFLDSVRIGISAGRMWSGGYGSQARMTYGVMGNETNMAARLMGKAQAGEVLISEPIFRRANDRFEFRSLGKMLMKGGSKPIGVWTVQDPWSQRVMLPQFSHRLVGREETLAQLTALWEKVQMKQGQSVVLSGESGIGKSHLAVAFAERHTKTMTLWGSGDSFSQYTAYSAWREVFLRLFGTIRAVDAGLLETIRPKLAQLDLADDPRLPLLGDLFGVPLADNATTAAFEPQVRQESLFALLLTVVQRAAAQEPLLIVLDNAQWLDEASSKLASELAHAITESRVMLLQLSRTSPTDETTTLTLSALSCEELEEFVTERLGAPVSALLFDILRVQTVGNPFFAEALLSVMQDTAQIVYAAPVWRVADKLHAKLVAAGLATLEGETWRLSKSADLSLISVELPDTVHASILNRLDQLTEQNKLLLKVASVIGKQFDLDLVHRAYPQSLDYAIMNDEAERCVEQGFVLPLDNTSYAFQQHTTQEVTYSTLLFAQRRQLHAAVADALTSPEYAHDYTTEVIAAHAYEGQDWLLAQQAYQQLGREAQSLYANQQAIFAYQRAAEVAALAKENAPAELFAIQFALGELHTHVGEFEKARGYLKAAHGLAATNSQFASICRWTARTYELQGRYDEALAQIERGLAYECEQAVGESAEMRLIAGLIHTRRGEYQAASELVAAVLRSVKDAALQGRAHNLAGIIQRLRGNSQAALAAFEQALARYESINNLRGRALALNQIASVRFDQARYDEALQLYRDALAIFVQTGDRYNQMLVANNLGGIARKQGDYSQALQYYDEALHAFAQISGWVEGAIELNRGGTFVQLDRFAEAQTAFDRAEQLFGQSAVRDMLPELYRERAEMALRQADFEAANRLIEQSLSLADELNMETELLLSAERQQAIRAARMKNG